MKKVSLLSLLIPGVISAWILPQSFIRSRNRLTAASTSSLEGISGTWDREAWIAGFDSMRTEECYEIEDSTIPKDIQGTLFRNGHAKFKVGETSIAHPFDGDGAISAVTFKDGRCFFRNRFVQTAGYVKETKSGKIEYRGTFGTQKEGGILANIFDLRRKNVANTNVLYWGGRLLALWEGGLPYLMNPITLQTYGESRLDRVLKPGQNLGAHPRYDPLTNRYVLFSTDPDPRKTKVIVYEFDDQFKLVSERREEFPGFSLMHDFVITKDFYVFFKAPLSVNPLPWVFGLKGIASCIKFEESQPAMVYLIPRGSSNNGKPLVEIPVDAHFSFHFSNAYDDEDTGEVVVDIIRVPKLYLTDTKGRTGSPIWETVNYETEVPKSTLWRYRLDPENRSFSSKELYPNYCDFPSIHQAKSGRPYRYSYLTAGRDDTYPTPVGTLTKFDVQEGRVVESWTAAPYEFISESVVVPRHGKELNEESGEEDDVYVTSFLFNGKTKLSEILIFDAKSISKGPVSRLQLKSNIPLSLHGCWSPKVFEGEDILRKWKVFNALERNKWGTIDSGMAPIIDF